MIDRIIAALEDGKPYRYRDEVTLHYGLERAMALAGLEPQPEVRVGERGRIDFLVGDVGIEVKVGGAIAALRRQVTRYAADPRINHLLVVTTQHRHRAVAGTVADVPVRVLTIGAL